MSDYNPHQQQIILEQIADEEHTFFAFNHAYSCVFVLYNNQTNPCF
jgi:hypothetical protein